MPTKKLKLAFLFLWLAAFLSWQNRSVQANQGGPATQLTGAPGEQTCATASCHVGNDPNGATGTLRISGLPAAYRPNQDIDLTVTLTQTNRPRFGFQITAIDDQGRKAGELIVTDTARTQKGIGFVGGNQREYVSHTLNGTLPNSANQGSWSLRWKAPAQSIGRVTFYVAGNAANGNGATSGDFIYTTNQSLQFSPALPAVASVSAASFATGALAPETIASAFGTGLSQNVAVAGSIPLPTELDGTQLLVRDAFNIERAASLFFVSPGQINYLVPLGTFPGAATVTVRRNGVDAAQGTLTIETFTPALFSANATGQGIAAAVVLRLRNGQQIYEPVSRAENGSQVAIPIDLGPDTGSDQVYLLLFGTGFRSFAQPSAMTVTVGGLAVPVLGYAAVDGLAGLDQCNIGPLPRSLAGRGTVNVVLTAGANTVSVNIK
ncbi:MAG TPA: hypothetical protein PKD31_02630 [Blastocatellia bacterium]|nr:hypothetical protein [Blastocatellia bacterium]